MKRRDLIHYLNQQGCQLVREGAEHSIWENPQNRRRTSIPRHREIPEFTTIRICKQLEIPPP
ncbi:type II toxin-antitoxin system HicA family toxin [Gloeocapsa sp. PCC 73106]|uniref:type II toxin-antitoxin system HicA family toxin n=1 Tax=Gloeocapsa sp. PCC 73106 TaxID=102232 RepID=UPI0002AC9392|nr:type II toxin-antitoxin system HicA family toxin [Gloeocapsa sp. PCC 73106]ELR99729.1 YcfA-like protein [Gloeocapsa sp. PCC 73106]